MKNITKTTPNTKTSSAKIKPKPKFNLLAIIGAVLLVVAIPLALYLLSQNSDNRNQAAGHQGKCVEQCPGSDGVLRNCTPPEADGSSQDSLCNQKGRVELCGGKKYICSKANGKWIPAQPTLNCGWCGKSCGPVKNNQVCPMIAPPANAACLPDQENHKCVIVAKPPQKPTCTPRLPCMDPAPGKPACMPKLAEGSWFCPKPTIVIKPTATPTPVPVTCGWCGTGCGPIKKNQVCPMIAPPAGYSCVPDKNKQTCVKVAAESPNKR